MKKKLFCLLLILILPISLLFVGCGGNSSEGQNPSDQIEFVTVKNFGDLGYAGISGKIIVNKATKVMYYISTGDNYSSKDLVVLLNSDGTPMIFQGDLDEYESW